MALTPNSRVNSSKPGTRLGFLGWHALVGLAKKVGLSFIKPPIHHHSIESKPETESFESLSRRKGFHDLHVVTNGRKALPREFVQGHALRDGRLVVAIVALVKRFKLDGSARKDHHGDLLETQLLAKVYACLLDKHIKAKRIDYSEIDDYDRPYQQSCDPNAIKAMAFNRKISASFGYNCAKNSASVWNSMKKINFNTCFFCLKRV